MGGIMIAEIIRLEETAQGSLGILRINKTVQCFTLERSYLFNRPNESAIPTGSYLCKLINSSKFGVTYEVTDVPGRSHILFHVGNTIKDSTGCILLGSTCGDIDGQRAVLCSRAAFNGFMGVADGVPEFRLVINDAF
jgi:hypothetical protein